MVASKSPAFTDWPSLTSNWVRMPSICGRITTLCNDSTEPMPLMNLGTSCCATLTTRTGIAVGAASRGLAGRVTAQAATASIKRTPTIRAVFRFICMGGAGTQLHALSRKLPVEGWVAAL